MGEGEVNMSENGWTQTIIELRGEIARLKNKIANQKLVIQAGDRMIVELRNQIQALRQEGGRG